MAWVYLYYNANGGSGAPSTQSKYTTGASATFTVSSTTPTRTGYRFTSWNTQSGGGGTTYRAGNTIAVRTASGSATLYAQWSKRSYSVTVEGSNCSTSGGGSYTYGSSCTAKCTPNTGYYFRYWEDGDGDIVSYSSSYTFTVTGSTYLYAVCDRITYTITTNCSPSGVATTSGGGTKNYGASYTLSFSIVDGHYDWVGWYEGNTLLTSNVIYTSNAYSNRTITAKFSPKSYNINLSASPSAGGTATGGGSKTYGSVITVTATPNNHYDFVNWTEGGTVVSYSSSYTFTVSGGRTLVANFKKHTYTYTLTYDANGGVITHSSDYYTGTALSHDFTVWTGEEAVVRRDNYTFQGWGNSSSGSIVNYQGGEIITLDTDTPTKTIYAKWKGNPVSVTISIESDKGVGGSVDPSSGTYSWDYESYHTLTATANTGYSFVNWTNEVGEVLSTNTSYGFTVTNETTITANFTRNSYTVSTACNPSYAATVNGAGTYKYGDTAIITCTIVDTHFTPSHFEGWYINGAKQQGDIYTGCRVIVAADTTVTAKFNIPTYTIAATAQPRQGGTVSGTGTYTYKSVCTLTAAENTGYEFVNWTKNGEVVGTNKTYIIGSVGENLNLVAVFKAKIYTITGACSPAGAATITVVGGAEHAYGTLCTITRTSNTDYNFIEWRNSDGIVLFDTGWSCSFTVTESTTVTAYYERVYTYKLHYELDGGSGGPSDPDPVGPTTRTSISFHVPATRPTRSGYYFEGWSWTRGGSVNVRPDRDVTLYSSNPSRTLYAVWTPATTYYVNITSNNSSVCEVTGSGYYTYGEYCTAKAIIKAEYTGLYAFDCWKDSNLAVVSDNPEYTFMVTGNTVLVAWISGNPVDITITNLPAVGGTTDPHGTIKWGNGTTHTIKAIPTYGYVFDKWVKGTEQQEYSYNATTSITVNGTEIYTAIFKKDTFTVQLASDGHCSVHLEDVSGPSSATYVYEDMCRALCIVDAGYKFDHWELDSGAPISTLPDYSFRVEGPTQLYAVTTAQTYLVKFHPGDTSGRKPEGGGPFPGKDNTIICNIDTWYQYPTYGWEYISKLYLNPGRYGQQGQQVRNIDRPAIGWLNTSTYEIHRPFEYFTNIGQKDTTVNLEVKWDNGEYTFVENDRFVAQDWSHTFLYYTLVQTPDITDTKYWIGYHNPLPDISKDPENLYAQWQGTTGKVRIEPENTAYKDKVVGISYKYYTSNSGTPISGSTEYLTDPSIAEFDVENEFSYTYSIEVAPGYSVYPFGGTGTMSFTESEVPYTKVIKYKIEPIDVTTRFLITPTSTWDSVGKVYAVDKFLTFNNYVYTAKNGTTIMIYIDQTEEEKELYNFIGYYDQHGNFLGNGLTDGKHTLYYDINYENSVVEIRFEGNQKLHIHATPNNNYCKVSAVWYDKDPETGEYTVLRYIEPCTEGWSYITLDALQHNTVTLKAIATGDYIFKEWSLAIDSYLPEVNPKYNQQPNWWGVTIHARFDLATEVVAESEPKEAGTVKLVWRSYESIEGSTTSLNAIPNTTIQLRAHNNDLSKYRFKYWARYIGGPGGMRRLQEISNEQVVDISVNEDTTKNHYYAIYGNANKFTAKLLKKGEGIAFAFYNEKTYSVNEPINDIGPTDSVVFTALNEEETDYGFYRWSITNTVTGETTYDSGTWENNKNTLTISSWDSDYTITAIFDKNANKLRVSVAVAIYSSGSMGEYDGTCAGVGVWWEDWRNACNPYYDSETGLGGQCTWYAHGRTAQMRGNAHAGAPWGNGTSGDGWNGNAINWDNAGYYGGNWYVTTNPSVGDVAIYNSESFSPTYGHVAVVEAVGEDEAGFYIVVSEFNRPGLGLPLMSNITKLRQSDIDWLQITYLTNTTDKVINIKPNAEGINTYSQVSERYETVSNAGSVSIVGGITINNSTHAYNNGGFCSITATPENGYQFLGWIHKGNVIEDQYTSFNVDENTEGTYLAMFWIPGYGGFNPPTPEELLNSMYMSITYYYFKNNELGNDYWNYKYNKWLNLGDKNAYDVVEYIESTGEHFINTLYKCNNHIQLEVKGKFISTDSLQLMGYDGWENSFMFGVSGGKFIFANGDQLSAGNADTNNHTFMVDVGNCRLDSTRYETSDITTTGGNISLFCSGYLGTEVASSGIRLYNPCKFRMTSCRIWDDGELVRDFIPVKRRIDGATGLWDNVYKKFYRNLYYKMEGETQVVKEFNVGPIIEELNKFTD